MNSPEEMTPHLEQHCEDVMSPPKDKHYADAGSSPILNNDTAIRSACILDAPVSEPLTNIEQKLLTSLVKRVLFQTKDGTVKCKTGGTPLTLMHVPKCRVNSSSCTNRTKRRRSKVAETMLKVSSGGTTTCLASQLGHGVKRLGKKAKETFYEKAGIKI